MARRWSTYFVDLFQRRILMKQTVFEFSRVGPFHSFFRRQFGTDRHFFKAVKIHLSFKRWKIGVTVQHWQYMFSKFLFFPDHKRIFVPWYNCGMLAGLQELVQFENKQCSSFSSFFLGLLFGFLAGYFVAIRPTVAGSRWRDGTGRGRSNNLWWLVIVASSCWKTCIFFSCPFAVFFIHTVVVVLGTMPVEGQNKSRRCLTCAEECGVVSGWGGSVLNGPRGTGGPMFGRKK